MILRSFLCFQVTAEMNKISLRIQRDFSYTFNVLLEYVNTLAKKRFLNETQNVVRFCVTKIVLLQFLSDQGQNTFIKFFPHHTLIEGPETTEGPQ